MMGILFQLQMKNPYSDFWKLNIAPQKRENISYDVHWSLLHSVSCFSSQLSFLCLHTHPRTNPDNGRLTIALSRSLYLCLVDKTAL